MQAYPGGESCANNHYAALTRAWPAARQVRVFPAHPEGVVSVKFKLPDPAAECVRLMHGRFFGGRQLHAALWDGVTNYGVVKAVETEEDEQARLERFAAELEAGK